MASRCVPGPAAAAQPPPGRSGSAASSVGWRGRARSSGGIGAGHGRGGPQHALSCDLRSHGRVFCFIFLKRGRFWVGARPQGSGETSWRGLSRLLGAGGCGEKPPGWEQGFWQSPAVGLGSRAGIASHVPLPFHHLPACSGLMHVMAPPPALCFPHGACHGVGQVPHGGATSPVLGPQTTIPTPPHTHTPKPSGGAHPGAEALKFLFPRSTPPRCRAACPPRRRRGISQPSPDRIKEKYTSKQNRGLLTPDGAAKGAEASPRPGRPG